MEELLKIFTIPDNTTMEEHSIVVDGGAIIGNHSDLGFGVIADSVIAGERVKINGNVIGKEDIRIDMWSQISGDVRTKKNAYIGEFVNIDGRLVVEGDMDVGKDVKIGSGFEAKGMIVVRNPIPVLIYIFLYLTELIRMGKDEEVEKAMDDLFPDESEDLDMEKLLMIPSGSKINLDTIRVPDKAVIGSNCRMMGNIRASSIIMGSNNTLFGSIKTIGKISIGEGNSIHGNLVTRGDVQVSRNTHILGEINGGRIIIHEQARVDGAMRATNDVIITRDEFEKEAGSDSILDLIPEPVESKEIKITEKKPQTIESSTSIQTEEPETEKKIPEERPSAKETTVKKVAAQKATSKKTTARKTTVKKDTAQKTTVQKAIAKNTTAQKSTAQKSTAQKSTAQKSTAQKSTAQKSTAQKSTAQKPTAQKSTAQKSTARKSTAQKSTAQKTTAQKATVQKATTKKKQEDKKE